MYVCARVSITQYLCVYVYCVCVCVLCACMHESVRMCMCDIFDSRVNSRLGKCPISKETGDYREPMSGCQRRSPWVHPHPSHYSSPQEIRDK